MNVACPECATVYRLDPARIPGNGVATRCRECDTPFRVDPTAVTQAGRVVRGSPVRPRAPGHARPPGTGTAAGRARPVDAERSGEGRPRKGGAGRPVFGPQDPRTRARRLARALVSDIKVYNPDRWRASLDAGTLRSDFRSDILKSWEEYVAQVGEPMAKGSPFFRDALIDILAEGRPLF
jgi:predicted Zn finger-like uncharacterized protein